MNTETMETNVLLAGGKALEIADAKARARIDALELSGGYDPHTYEGIDLTDRFSNEIAASPYNGNAWAWIKARIQAANYTGLHIGDYIPFTTTDGKTVNACIAGMDTYYRFGNPSIPHHIDFISRDLWHETHVMNKVNYNNGIEGLTYAWYCKDVGSSEFTLTNTFTSNYYNAAMSAAQDGKQIYCVITDASGNSVTTDTVTISIKAEGLAIVKHPAGVTVADGANAEVTVEATGEGLTYAWYFKDIGASKFNLTNTFTSNFYRVAMSTARDGRQLYCVITDANGNSVTTDTVTIGMLPEGTEPVIVKQPASAAAALGETVEVTVNAAGGAPVEYPWLASDLYHWINSLSGSVPGSTDVGGAPVSVDYTADGIYNKLPEALKAVIVPKAAYLPKRYSDSGKLTEDNAGGWTEIGMLWLPSEMEVTGTNVFGCSKYGNTGFLQYPLFLNNGKRAKSISNNSVNRKWLTLSATEENDNGFVSVLETGTISNTFASLQSSFPICFRIA